MKQDSVGGEQLGGVNKVYFIDAKIGYAVGGNGIILKTTDGGASVEEPSITDSPMVKLYPNYPNPFRINTRIRFELPVAALVSVKIYDISGRVIYNLINEQKGAGAHVVLWNGQDNAGRKVAGGIYFYTLEVMGSDFKNSPVRLTGKMVILR